MKKILFTIAILLNCFILFCGIASADSASVDMLFADLHIACEQLLSKPAVLSKAVDAAEDYFILNTNRYVHLPAGMYRLSETTDRAMLGGTDMEGNVEAVTFARMRSFHPLNQWRAELSAAGYSTSSKSINQIPFVYAAKNAEESTSSARLFDAVFLYNYNDATYAIAASGTSRTQILSLGRIVKTIGERVQRINLNVSALCLYPTQSFTLVGASEEDVVFGFYSSRNKIASVDRLNGVVTAKKSGSCTISVVSSAGGLTLVPVTVKSAPSIKNVSAKKTIRTGASYQLTPRVSLNSQATITKIAFTYRSSNVRVATVSANGIVTGIRKGNTTITISASTGSVKKVKLSVR